MKPNIGAMQLRQELSSNVRYNVRYDVRFMLGIMLGIWDRKIAQSPFKQRDSHEQDVRFNQKVVSITK
jgi:hypothetical protein